MKKKVEATKVGEDAQDVEDEVVVESPLTIKVNGRELATLLCSPLDLEYLTIGYLFAEGVLSGVKDVKEVSIDEHEGLSVVETTQPVDLEGFQRRIITSGCIGYYSDASLSVKRIVNELCVGKAEIIALMRELESGSALFKATGGVHSSALCEKGGVIYLSEDIGRHNTIDKITGYLLKEGIDPSDKLLLTTGRLSSEMVLKAARAGIPLVASRSAPTDLAVSAARRQNVTLIGFVRNNRLNVYNNKGKVKP